MESAADILEVTNNFVTEDDGLECQFIAVAPLDGIDGYCIDADAQECSLTETTPTQTPPSETPTSAASPISIWKLTAALSLPIVLQLFLGS
jgi:hypothetical protein